MNKKILLFIVVSFVIVALCYTLFQSADVSGSFDETDTNSLIYKEEAPSVFTTEEIDDKKE